MIRRPLGRLHAALVGGGVLAGMGGVIRGGLRRMAPAELMRIVLRILALVLPLRRRRARRRS